MRSLEKYLLTYIKMHAWDVHDSVGCNTEKRDHVSSAGENGYMIENDMFICRHIAAWFKGVNQVDIN